MICSADTEGAKGQRNDRRKRESGGGLMEVCRDLGPGGWFVRSFGREGRLVDRRKG